MYHKWLNSKRNPKSNNGIDVHIQYAALPNQTYVHAPNRLRYTNQIVLQIITGSLHITKWQWRHSRTHAIAHYLVGYWIWISQTVQTDSNEVECEGGKKSWLDCSYMWKWWEIPSTCGKWKNNNMRTGKRDKTDSDWLLLLLLLLFVFSLYFIQCSHNFRLFDCMELMERTGCSKLCPVKEIVGEIGGFFVIHWNFTSSIHSFICFDHIGSLLIAVSAIIIRWLCGSENARILDVNLRILKKIEHFLNLSLAHFVCDCGSWCF